MSYSRKKETDLESNLIPFYPSLTEISEDTNKKVTAENLILEAEQLKKDLLELNQQIQKNSLLAAQHRLLQKGKLVIDANKSIETGFYPISHEFNQILEIYKKINNRYTNIKRKAIESNFIGENDVEALEKNNLKNYNYYPLYQHTLNQNIATLHQQHERLAIETTQKMRKIETNANNRESKYLAIHLFNGVISVISLGAALPFLFGGLLVNQIDNLITSIRLLALNHKISKSHSTTEKKIKETEKTMVEDIEKSPYDRFKQRFFSVCKSKQEINLDNKNTAENNNQSIPLKKVIRNT